MRHLDKEHMDNLIREYAYRWYLIRMKHGIPGSEYSDWEKAKNMIELEYRVENPIAAKQKE